MAVFFRALSFNPTLVRLRLCQGLRDRAADIAFQSHAGSIEACLERYIALLAHGVSIPRWFD